MYRKVIRKWLQTLECHVEQLKLSKQCYVQKWTIGYECLVNKVIIYAKHDQGGRGNQAEHRVEEKD